MGRRQLPIVFSASPNAHIRGLIMNRDNFAVAGLIILLSLCFGISQDLLAQTTNKRATANTAVSGHHPSIVYFYANWCADCKMFTPALKKLVAAYRDCIDFQPINVDDPAYRPVCVQFHIHEIPAVYVYNSKEQAIFGKSGYIDEQLLNKALQSVCPKTVSHS
jgi:thioredoxin-like negative regulator of GroEL